MTKQYTRPSANILLEAADLQERKGQDYNNAQSSVSQADYYPRGVWSILDIVNAKYLRMVSVLETMQQGGKANFESIEDSAIDLINYASFLAAYMRGEVPGQNPDCDIFNRPVTEDTHPTDDLIPTKFKTPKMVTGTLTIGSLDSQPYSFTNNRVTSFTVSTQEPKYEFDELQKVVNGWSNK